MGIKLYILLACSLTLGLNATKERITIYNGYNTDTLVFVHKRPSMPLLKDAIAPGESKYLFTPDIQYKKKLYLITANSTGIIHYELAYDPKTTSILLMRSGDVLEKISYDPSKSELSLRIDEYNNIRLIDPLKKVFFKGRPECCG